MAKVTHILCALIATISCDNEGIWGPICPGAGMHVCEGTGGLDEDYGAGLPEVPPSTFPCQELNNHYVLYTTSFYPHAQSAKTIPVIRPPSDVSWGNYGYDFGQGHTPAWAVPDNTLGRLMGARRVNLGEVPFLGAGDTGSRMVTWTLASGPGKFRREGSEPIEWSPVARVAGSDWVVVVADWGTVDGSDWNGVDSWRIEPDDGTTLLGYISSKYTSASVEPQSGAWSAGMVSIWHWVTGLGWGPYGGACIVEQPAGSDETGA